jgi:hypothetical protein
MTDSSTAMGWLHKSNHDPEDAPVHSEVARFHALKVTVDAVGVDVLGFTSNDIGTHLVRSSLAMMMYLTKEQI